MLNVRGWKWKVRKDVTKSYRFLRFFDFNFCKAKIYAQNDRAGSYISNKDENLSKHNYKPKRKY